MTQHWAEQKQTALPFNVVQFSVMPVERKVLHERIELRFKQMLEQGFEAEVRELFQREDLHKDLPSIRAVGYRQMWEHLEGELDYDEMVFKGIVATRQLAKRQTTWLRSWENLHRLDSLDEHLVDNAVSILKEKGIC